MIKSVFCWTDRHDVSSEECQAHYEQVHMKLAQKAFKGVPGFRGLVYNRIRSATVNDFNRREPREIRPDIDGFVELWFDDEETLAASFDKPEMAALFEDHKNFMSIDIVANVRAYRVEETTILGAPATGPNAS